MSAAAARRFRPTDRLGGILMLLLTINAVDSLALGVVNFGELQLLERFR